eukprot:1483984-Amphidinium_carterae.1
MPNQEALIPDLDCSATTSKAHPVSLRESPLAATFLLQGKPPSLPYQALHKTTSRTHLHKE